MTPLTPEQLKERRIMREALARADARASERDPERAGLNLDALALPVNAGFEQLGKNRPAVWRSNVFECLYRAGSITSRERDAGHEWMELYARWKGLDGRPEGERVTVDTSRVEPLPVCDRMIRAGREWADRCARLGPTNTRLLLAYAVAIVEEDRPMSWRGIVESVTKYKDPAKQAGAVITLCRDMAEVVG